MKIISNKECYVQGNDLINSVYYTENISTNIYFKISSVLCEHNLTDNYIKINDPELIEFIISNDDILDFFELNGKKINDLELIALKLKIFLMDIDDKNGEEMSLEERNKAIIDSYREKRKKEYMLSQIKEMIAYKKKESKSKYPNIPNPCVEPIKSEEYGACLSMNYDNILVYDLDNKPISEDVDKEFCKVAYQMLVNNDTEKDINEEDIECKISSDKKYISVTKQKELENKLIKKYPRKIRKNI